MSTSGEPQNRGIVAIVALILFLVAACFLAVPGLNGGGGARNSHAAALVGRNGPIAKALDQLHYDVGRYPTTDEGLGALLVAPPFIKNWKGPYIAGSLEELKDPWGGAFNYRSPAAFSSVGYDLWSAGPDGKDAEGQADSDDIRNWR